jgi:phosphatidylglycerophosphate synthase
MKNIETHHRILDTFTGPVERPLLRWLAARMPQWVTPDSLTAVGVLGSLIAFAGYGLTYLDANFLWLATLGFVINWFGDSLDGTLARFRKIERHHYGFYIDHTVDVFDEVLVFLGLGISPYVRFDLACLALIGYLILSVVVYIDTCVSGEFKLSYGRLGPTEARLLAIGANALVFFAGNPTVTSLSIKLTVYDWLVMGVILLLTGIILTTVFNRAKQLAKIDAPKQGGEPE